MTESEKPVNTPASADAETSAAEAPVAAAEKGLAVSEPAAEKAAEIVSISRGELESLRQECAALKDQLLRRRADFENYKKRVERDRQSAYTEATADLMKTLLPTLDNLERALAAEGDEVGLREGLSLIHRGLVTLLESRGLRSEDPLGQPFDPERHQALSHEVVPGSPPGLVVEVFRKAYLLGDRLLRPALVKVAKEAASGEGPASKTFH